MTEDEKRRIAEVVAGAVFGKGTADQSRLFAYMTSHPASDYADPLRANGSFEVAWWAVMDWVDRLGGCWECGGQWDLHCGGAVFTASEGEDGERWARLLCVAQAIDAGALR